MPEGCLTFDVTIVLYIAFFFFDDANKFLRQWSTIGLESFIIMLLMKLTIFHQKFLHAFNTPKLPLVLCQKKRKAIYRIRNHVNIICAL